MKVCLVQRSIREKFTAFIQKEGTSRELSTPGGMPSFYALAFICFSALAS